MSEVRLVVRDAERDWSGTIHGSCADRAAAALSADPVTLDEFEAAVARFFKPRADFPFFCNLRPGSNDEPYDAGLVAIDLLARLVYVDSSYSSPGKTGAVDYHNGNCCTDIRLPYHLADDWRFLSAGEGWQRVGDALRREPRAKPLDARAVFYGKPLLEFITRRTFEAFARRDEIAAAVRMEWIERARQRLAKQSGIAPDEVPADRLTEEEIAPRTCAGQEVYASPFYDTLRAIHADWLMTPRDDLGGKCPREVALERSSHVDRDLQDRCDQWTLMDACPPGLAESAHAYQYGGFGTHELVEYYEFVRALLWSCWKCLEELAESSNPSQRPNAMMVGDFLTTEVPRLEAVGEAWLDEPDPECHGRTPRSIISRERARIPEAVSGREAMIDPDCPCCQMMADMPGPMFWGLDGCNMDADFAFDIYHRTREEWDEEQRRSEAFHRRFTEEREECNRLGVSDSRPRENGPNAV